MCLFVMFVCRWISQRLYGRNESMRRRQSHCRWQALCTQARQSLTLKTSISMTFPVQTMNPSHRYTCVKSEIHGNPFLLSLGLTLFFISSDVLWFFRGRGGERSRWCVWVQEENRLSISSCTL